MNKNYYLRLKELSAKYLHCNLDDNEPGYIPPDLKERTYRWSLYIYSNLYKIGDDNFFERDRDLFIEMAQTFRKEHMISWTRDYLIELNKEKILQLHNYLNDRINNTNSFFELKVCLYLFRELNDNWFVIDQFMIDRSPGLKEFIIERKI